MSVRATRYGPGREASSFREGDFILTHRKAIPSAVIAFGQGMRFRGARRPFAHYSHAALIVGHDGALVEALGKGVERTHISRYRDVEYHLVRIDATDRERRHVVRYGEAMRERHEKYGWAEIVSLGLQLLTGARLALTTDGRAICSGLVAAALERTGAIFNRNAGCCMPADLAEHFRVTP